MHARYGQSVDFYERVDDMNEARERLAFAGENLLWLRHVWMFFSNCWSQGERRTDLGS